MAVFLVIPLFIMALIMGVQSWLWRAIFGAAVVAAWSFLGPAWIAVPVVLTLGIFFANRLYRVTGSKV